MASIVNNDVPMAAVFVDSDISEQFSSLNMDLIQKVIEYVKTVDGVLDVHEMDEEIFDCNSGGVPHQHCMDRMVAQKPV